MRFCLALAALLTVGCAAKHAPLPLWFRNVPADWIAPPGFEGCARRYEVALEDGSPSGRAAIRLDCSNGSVLIDKRTKKVIRDTRS